MPYAKIAGVYRILNTTTNLFYVGSSCNVYGRRSVHFHLLKANKHRNKKLQEAYNTYGKDCFIFEVLEYVKNTNNLKEREQYYIDFYDTATKGYNVLKRSDSSLGYKHSERTKNSISERQKGAGNHFWGKSLSEEHKARISAGNKGKKHSADAIEKTRRAHFKPIRNVETQKIYEYISQAAKDYGVSVTAISNTLRGKAETCCGCHWEYI